MILGVTGHRPHKLPGDLSALKRAIVAELGMLAPEKIITGMAAGTDQIIARICVRLRVPFVAAIPHEGQEKPWPATVQSDYFRLLARAAEIVFVSTGPYDPEKMHKRNRWIVDHSDRLLAVFDGSGGGTENTVSYAIRERGWNVGREIVIIDPGACL